MRVAKHIQIARTKGAEAGMAAFLAAPVSKLHTSYAEITSKRTDKTRLDAYCKLFNVPRTVEAVVPSNTPDMADMFAQFKAFIEAQTGGSTPEKSEPSKSAPKVKFITHDEAWAALGSDPTFRATKDERRNGPATNGQLYRLNEAGLLTLNA